MSRYDPLKKYLESVFCDEINLSFSDIEKVFGFNLPLSAYKYNAWWANGGHSQSYAWLDAGYKVGLIKIFEKKVTFRKTDVFTTKKRKKQRGSIGKKTSVNISATAPDFSDEGKSMMVYGYEFRYLQDLLPQCNESGDVIEFYSQNKYNNIKNLSLSLYGEGAFCRFSINAENRPGVYLWMVDKQIIYIGETAGLRQRFNIGYGNISPRNCYAGGQSTNCKMNKAVLNLYKEGKIIKLYFYNTTDYKRVELDLLNKINTMYNKKNNYGNPKIQI